MSGIVDQRERLAVLEDRIAALEAEIVELTAKVDHDWRMIAKQAAVNDGLRLWVNAAKLGVGSEIDAVHALREALK